MTDICLGYNTNGFPHHNLEDTLTILSDLGYGAIALTLDVHHLDPFKAEDWKIDQIAKGLRERNLRCVVETGARYLLDSRQKHQPTLVSLHPADRRARLAFLKKAFDIAEQLEAEALSLWSGANEEGADDDASWPYLIDGIGDLVEISEVKGIPLAFEPEPGMVVSTLAGYDQLKNNINSPMLGLCLDIGHVQVSGEMSIPKAIERYADKIVQVHIEDIKGQEHIHLPFGEGDIDFEPVIAAISQHIGDKAPVCVELSRDGHRAPEVAEQSMVFLQNCLGVS